MSIRFDHAPALGSLYPGVARLTALLAAALFLACTPAVRADDFTVAVESIDYPPLYNGTDPDHYQGFARELLDMFGAHYQHRFHYVSLPLNRLYAEFFTAGNFDLKFPDNPKWQADLKKGLPAVYSAPVVDVAEGTFVAGGKAGKGIGGIKSLVTLTGFTPFPYAGPVRSGAIKLYFADNLESMRKMLEIGRVDGIYASDMAMRAYVAKDAAKTGGAQQRIVLDPSLPGATAAFCLSTLKHPELIAQFNQFLAAEGESIAALKRKYGVPEGGAAQAESGLRQ